MDLIGELAGKLGIDPSAAQALAGAVLGGAQAQVASQVGESEAEQIGAAIPELQGWKAQAKALTGTAPADAGGLLGGALGALTGGESAGGLLGALGGALGSAATTAEGGPALAAITSVLSKLNLSPAIVGTVAPLALSFLQERLPPELLDKVKHVAPFLSGGAAGGLGGLFGG